MKVVTMPESPSWEFKIESDNASTELKMFLSESLGHFTRIG